MSQKKGASKILPVLLCILMLAALMPGAAFGAGEDPVILASVTVDGGTYTMSGESITIAEPMGSSPEFELKFSHNVTNEDHLASNLRLLSIVEEDTGKSQSVDVYAGGDNNSVLVIKGKRLAQGRYQVIVEAGVSANAGSTSQEYVISFMVGDAGGGEDPGPDEGETYKVTFDVSGVGDTTYYVQIKKDGKTYPPQEDGTFLLPAGRYTYAVSASGYATEQGAFTVKSGEETISVSMRDKVTVTFKTTPSSATVKLKDGQDSYVDAQSDKVFRVTPGVEYTYVAEAEGYTTGSSRFTPIDDETRTVTLEKRESTDGYHDQGTGGNTLTMLEPGAGDIKVEKETSDYYYNKITKAFPSGKAVSFGFTLGAGINSFNEDTFKDNNMPLIKIYKSYGSGSPVAEYNSGRGDLKYIDFADRVITVGVNAGKLADGTYVIVFGSNISGNNPMKTLGKDVVFEFTVGASAGENGAGDGGGGGGTDEEGSKASVSSAVISAPAAVDKSGRATLAVDKNAFANAIKKAEEGKSGDQDTLEVKIAVTGDASAQSLAAGLPKEGLAQLGKSSGSRMTLTSSLGDFTFDQKALASLGEKASGGTVSLEIAPAGEKDDPALKDAAGKTKGITRITLTSGDKAVTGLGGGKATLSLPYTLGEGEKASGVQAYAVASNGSLTVISGASYDGAKKRVTFTTDLTAPYYALGYDAQAAKAEFTDVANHWAKEAIQYVTDKGFFTGTSETTFSPDGQMTRAMFVTVLYRMAGSPEAAKDSASAVSFRDVPADSWYADAVAWAAAGKIADGVGDGMFAPDRAVTREQMAAMLLNYFNYLKKGPEGEWAIQLTYSDLASISKWAMEGVMFSTKEGFITGYPDGSFRPQKTATRAEVASILMRVSQSGN